MNRVLAVGSAKNVQQLAVAMKGDLSAGLHVVGVCLPPSESVDPLIRAELAEAGIQVFGTTRTVRRAVDACDARSVAVVAGDVGTAAVRTLSWELERSGVDLMVSSGLEEVSGRRVHVQSVAGLPLLRVDEPEFSGFRRVLKGAFDRSVAALALVVFSPLLLALAAIVRFTSKGPAFYLQTRVGRNGEEFRMVKFRSMYVGVGHPPRRTAEPERERRRPAVQDSRRPAGDADRPLPAPVLTRRAAAAVQRARRLHVARRAAPAAAVARSRSTARTSAAACWSSPASPACGRSAVAPTCPGRTRSASTCTTSRTGRSRSTWWS